MDIILINDASDQQPERPACHQLGRLSDIIETISDKVVVELESGAACLLPVTDVILDKDNNHSQNHYHKAYVSYELSRPLSGSHR